ncbi:hypothetical protein [Frigidibacter sp.]|uniref:hypothetical protein n=1 Tax=Frigidibacter sp. TaxID=2586418 RepID=UPI0027333BA8|nr:hypothetical protein [Frigidibacter sp.]MDP3341819.1 hypothetical protein [Frigidibacter sp.]
MTNPPTHDLSVTPPGHTYTATVKPEETSKDAWARVIKDFVLFAAALVFLGILAWICFDTVQSQTAPAEEKKWAMSFLTGAAGGLVGYLVKK